MVRAGSALCTTTNAVETRQHVVDMLSAYKLADALQVAVTASQEEYLLDDVMFVGSHVDQFRTGALSLILDMFCLHVQRYNQYND